MVTECWGLFGIQVQSGAVLGIAGPEVSLGGEEREGASCCRAQRSHPAGGWVLVLGRLPSSGLIGHALCLASAGVGGGRNGESDGKL